MKTLLLKELNLLNIVTPESSFFAMLGGICGTILHYLYGDGRGSVLSLLLILLVLDWITGIAAAHKDKSYTSDYGKVGVLRTLFILILPSAANLLDIFLQTPGFIFYGITAGLIYHTWVSMTANAARAGWERIIWKPILDYVSSEIQAKNERAWQRKQSMNKTERENQENE